MEGACRFPNCPWTGGVRDLYRHCEAYHPRSILTIDSENAFSITCSDFLHETLLLVCNGGLYWFLSDPHTAPGCVRRGIFPIGKSEILEYTIKIGRTGDACITYVGPCPMESLSWPSYNLEWSTPEILEYAQCTTMQIFFGSYVDSDVSMDEDVTAMEMLEVGPSVDDLQCPVCYDEEWSKSTCPICGPDSSLNFVDHFDEEQLIKSLTQFSEITQMMQMAA